MNLIHYSIINETVRNLLEYDQIWYVKGIIRIYKRGRETMHLSSRCSILHERKICGVWLKFENKENGWGNEK